MDITHQEEDMELDESAVKPKKKGKKTDRHNKKGQIHTHKEKYDNTIHPVFIHYSSRRLIRYDHRCLILSISEEKMCFSEL